MNKNVSIKLKKFDEIPLDMDGIQGFTADQQKNFSAFSRSLSSPLRLNLHYAPEGTLIW